MGCRFFHVTTKTNALEILRAGFKDGEGFYLTEYRWKGVWISDIPLEPNEGTTGDCILLVESTLSLERFAEFEWEEEGKPYREWLVPANMLNSSSTLTILSDE